MISQDVPHGVIRSYDQIAPCGFASRLLPGKATAQNARLLGGACRTNSSKRVMRCTGNCGNFFHIFNVI
jgi:hypothetical protein